MSVQQFYLYFSKNATGSKLNGESICTNEVCKVSDIEEVHYYLLAGPVWRWDNSDWLLGLIQSDAWACYAISSEIVYWCIHARPIYWIIGIGFHANQPVVDWTDLATTIFPIH